MFLDEDELLLRGAGRLGCGRGVVYGCARDGLSETGSSRVSDEMTETSSLYLRTGDFLRHHFPNMLPPVRTTAR